jgi:hypothetical protein
MALPFVTSRGKPSSLAGPIAEWFRCSCSGWKWRCSSTYTLPRPKMDVSRSTNRRASDSPPEFNAVASGPLSSPVRQTKPSACSSNFLSQREPDLNIQRECQRPSFSGCDYYLFQERLPAAIRRLGGNAGLRPQFALARSVHQYWRLPEDIAAAGRHLQRRE